jgi:U3 small nucleolar RNA-associated protein 20
MFSQSKEANSVVHKGSDVSVKSGIRFQKIVDRISRIDVDVVHKVRRRGDTLLVPDSGDSGSFFLDELGKLREINTDALFTRFFESMSPYAQSLVQLVHHLPQIIQVLLENIKLASEEKNDNIAAFFSLIAVLSRDTRQEFCPFFCTTLDTVVPLIDPSKPELTGEIFQLIAYLFKYLGKSLLQRLDEVRVYYASLLGHKREYVRSFGAETLGKNRAV